MSYAPRRDLSRVDLKFSEPSLSGIRAHERRQGLLSPDRRCFIQSMPIDSARRIHGNGVPVTANGGGVYSYTFPAQREQTNPYTPTSANFYSVQRSNGDYSHQQQGGRSSSRAGTPNRGRDYEPGAYSSSRPAMPPPPSSSVPSRYGTPQRSGYVDLERQSNVSRRY